MPGHVWARGARVGGHTPLVALLAAAALGFGGTVVAFGAPGAVGGERPRAPRAPSVGSIELVARTPLPGPPTGLALGHSLVGVSLALEGVLLVRRDDPSSGRRVQIDGAATAIHTDGRRFWVADLLHDRVLKLDGGGSVLGEAHVGGLPGGIALTPSDVWVLGLQEPSITLADRRNELPVVHLTFPRDDLWPGAIASGPHGVWVSTGHRTSVTLMDTEGYLTRGKVDVKGVTRLAATSDGVWAAREGAEPELVRIDGSTLVVHPRDLPGRHTVTAIDARAMLAVAVRRSLLALDAKTGALRARGAVERDRRLTHVVVDGSDIWAVDATRNELLRYRVQLRSQAVR